MNTVNRETLLQSCEFAAAAISGRQVMPSLACLRFLGDEIAGSNLDIFCVAKCAGLASPGFCLNARRVIQFLSATTGDEVSIEPGEDDKTRAFRGPCTVTLRCGGASLRLDAIPPEEFPKIPTDEFGEPFEFPGEAVNRVLPAVSTDTTRYVLNGVFFDPDGFVVATDGRRLFVCAAAVSGPAVIIPTELAKKVASAESTARIGKKWLAATNENGSIIGKLIEGNYPNWRAVPTEGGDYIGDTGLFDGAKAAAAIGGAVLRFDDGKLSCGDYCADADWTSVPMTIDAGFLLDAVRAGDGGTVKVATSDTACGNPCPPFVECLYIGIAGGVFRSVTMCQRP